MDRKEHAGKGREIVSIKSEKGKGREGGRS